MGIAKKGKRKLHHHGVEYFWWVGDDFEGYTGHQLEVTVATDDKNFLVKYYIDQQENYFVTVLGSNFPAAKTGGTWKRFSSPKFGATNIFTPKNITDLIDWCLDSTKILVEVDYRGTPLNNTLRI